MPDDMPDKELQRLYMQMQVLQQQAQQLQQQIQAIDQQLSELETVKEGLDKLKDVKPGTEVLVPFSGGIFIKAELKDSKDVLLNVGAGIAVSKPIPDTIVALAEQAEEMATLRV